MRPFLPLLFLLYTGFALAQPVIVAVSSIEDEVQPAVAPRGFAEMRGVGFGGEETDTKVFVNGVESIVPAEFLEDGELIFQIPQQTALGAASFVVSVDGVASAPFSFPVSEYAPIIADIGDAYHLDGTVVSEVNLAVPGEFIRVTIITGLGAIHPPPLTITMNGLPVPIISLEDTVEPFFQPGAYNMVVVVPLGLAPGFYPGNFHLGNTTHTTDGFLEVGDGPVPTPLISAGGIVLASLLPNVPTISPLSIISVFGQNISGETILFPTLDVDGNLATTLGGLCLEVGGVRGSIFAVTPTQVNAQTPAIEALGPVGVVLIRDCGMPGETRSTVEMVTVESATPGFFLFPPLTADGVIAARFNDGNAPVAPVGRFPNDSFGPSRPAQPGDIIILYGSGWGATEPSFGTGELATGAARVGPNANVMVTFGGIPVAPEDIFYVGVTPNAAGLYQLAIRVPAGAQAGNNEVVLTVFGKSTPLGPVVPVVVP